MKQGFIHAQMQYVKARGHCSPRLVRLLEDINRYSEVHSTLMLRHGDVFCSHCSAAATRKSKSRKMGLPSWTGAGVTESEATRQLQLMAQQASSGTGIRASLEKKGKKGKSRVIRRVRTNSNSNSNMPGGVGVGSGRGGSRAHKPPTTKPDLKRKSPSENSSANRQQKQQKCGQGINHRSSQVVGIGVGVGSKSKSKSKSKSTPEACGFTEKMKLSPSGKQSSRGYINERLEDLRGMSIKAALSRYTYRDDRESTHGRRSQYTMADLRYDIKSGYLKDPRKR